MASIYSIASSVVNRQSYENKCFPLFSTSKTYQALFKATTPAALQQVREVVAGKLSSQDLVIDSTTAYQYLAAAKMVDIDTVDKQQSTYKIREMALFSSKAAKEGLDEMNMLNAFSTPPLDKEDIDILLANELDNSHPLVKKAAFGVERDKLLGRIYTYCQEEALIIPEIAQVIESVIKDRIEQMVQASQSFPEATSVVFKGCSGAGKSFALHRQIAPYGIAVDRAVQSTDNLKNDIKARCGKIFSDQQVHLLGFSTFKMLSKVMKESNPTLSTIQEGWFNSVFAIETLFKDLKASGMRLEMHDFDGDYEALCLRVLARYKTPDAPKPPLEWVERGFKTSRESRAKLLEMLRPTDQYEFSFVHRNGEVDLTVDPSVVPNDPTNLDQEMTSVKQTVITEAHVSVFGVSLQEFVGLTVEQAFTKAKA